jgi:hypothetical protein
MKYVFMLFLVLSGCVTNSEYWHGCVDTTKLFIEGSTFKQDQVAHWCDAVEAERDKHSDLGKK